jgi:hypothetical protein
LGGFRGERPVEDRPQPENRPGSRPGRFSGGREVAKKKVAKKKAAKKKVAKKKKKK